MKFQELKDNARSVFQRLQVIMRLEFIEDSLILSLPFLHLYMYQFMSSSLVDNMPPLASYKFHWVKTQKYIKLTFWQLSYMH